MKKLEILLFVKRTRIKKELSLTDWLMMFSMHLDLESRGLIYRNLEEKLTLYYNIARKIVECKAHAEKVGGADVNKFIGALDVERGKYEQDGISVVGYFLSQSGFKGSVYDQEEERVK